VFVVLQLPFLIHFEQLSLRGGINVPQKRSDFLIIY